MVHANRRRHAKGEHSESTCKITHTQRESDWSCEQYSKRAREKESLKEKPPTWSSYIRTTEGKSKSKLGDGDCFMLLHAVYTRSELKLNVHVSDIVLNYKIFSSRERESTFLEVHVV